MTAHRLNRRSFIKQSAAGTLGLGILGNKSFPGSNQTLPRIKDYGRLGRTGAMVSDIGSGIPYSESVLKADACRNCPGVCEKTCPHNIAIRELLADANRKLS